MNLTESEVQLHVFVCTNQKPEGRACCANLGGKEFREQLKKRISAHPELKSVVRINSSGCLDKCSEGIACVIYPKGQWLTQVKMDDLDELELKILQLVKPS